MTSLADVFVQGRVDTRRFGTDIKSGLDSSDVRSGVDQAGKKVGGRFTGAFKSALKIGAVVAAGAAVAGGVKFLKGAVSEASDLGESINAVNVTFGKAAGGIKRLGQEAADAVGLSNNEFNSLAVQFSSFATAIAGPGGNVVGTMDEMTTRAADFASVMNLEVSDAAAKFQSGLAGESEPLKKFGIDLSAAKVEAFAYANGIAKAGATLTENEKVQARYGALMEQTAKTQGDFTNTSDSLANSQRILGANWDNMKATVGAKLIPALEQLSGWVLNTGLPALERFGGWVQDTLGPIFNTVVDEITGSVKAFAAAWKFNDGEITSSGLPGFMERVGYWARQAFDYIREDVIPVARDLAKSFRDDVIPRLKDMVKWVGDNKDLMIALGAGLVAAKVSLIAYNTYVKVSTAVTKAWAVAQKILNGTMKANPIGLVITAIGLLATGLVLAYRKSETFRNIVNGAFEKVAAAGRWLWNDVLQPVFKFLVNGFASVMDMYAKMLQGLSKVPGFGWAEKAADKMGKAADNARDLAKGIKDIPNKKDIKINVGATYANAKEVFAGKLAGQSYNFGGSGGAGSSMASAIGGDVDKFTSDVADKVRSSAVMGQSGRVLPKGSYSIGTPYLGYSGHYGADYPAPAGTPVYAAASGVVSRALSMLGSYGKHIFLGHPGGRETRYAHLSDILVGAGQMVRAGQVIGRVGSTGNSTGNHLHYEDRINGSPRNPATLGIFDVGGLLRSGGAAVNLSGRPERVLDPRTTQNFERLTRALDKQSTGRRGGSQRIVLDVGGGRTLTGIIQDEIDGRDSFRSTHSRMGGGR